jgi:hypothetical protein
MQGLTEVVGVRPWAISVTLDGVLGSLYYLADHFHFDVDNPVFDRDRIVLPPIFLREPVVGESLWAEIRPGLDRLAQSAAWAFSPNFDVTSGKRKAR